MKRHKRLDGNRSPNWAFMERFPIPHYDNPEIDYLWRLRIFQCPWGGVYLHKINTPDPRQVLHNHPFTFVSFVLRGGYTEYRDCPATYAVPHVVKRINCMRLNDWHWIDSVKPNTWTLMFVGKRQRIWGYLEEDGTYTDYDQHYFNDEFIKALEARGGGDVA